MDIYNTEKGLSPEEVEIEIILAEASKELDQIDYLIKNLHSTGPAPRPAAPGMGNLLPESSLEYRKKFLEYRRELKIAETKDKAVKLTEKSTLLVQLSAYDRTDKWAEEKAAKSKTLDERTIISKDLSYSQDLTMRRLSEKKRQKNPDLSERFFDTFAYNRTPDKSDESPDKSDKSYEIDLEKD